MENHKDFKFYIYTKYIGPEIKDDLSIYAKPEEHELIYCDGYIALTLFEYCYATWNAKTGTLTGGNLWNKGEYVLTTCSIKDIQGAFSNT
jgi:hypothetical protein